jgi:type IV pilus assembly protein PilA
LIRRQLAKMGHDMKKVQQGFTLIELMIVVAILGIVTVMALPTYQGYLVRAQIAEGLNLSVPLQYAVAAYYKNKGVFPADNAAAALPSPTSYSGTYVESISVNGAVISISYGNKANAEISGSTVTITAINNPGSMSWTCASGGIISNSLLPTSCR